MATSRKTEGTDAEGGQEWSGESVFSEQDWNMLNIKNAEIK